MGTCFPPATIAPGLFHVGVDEIISNEFQLIGGETLFTDIAADFAFGALTLRPLAIPGPSSGLLCLTGLFILGRARAAAQVATLPL